MDLGVPCQMRKQPPGIAPRPEPENHPHTGEIQGSTAVARRIAEAAAAPPVSTLA